ncbi:MAG: hypothetical protein UV73_C0005G0004 [Candidatus Gottesmanbacteria bacterium GW2011_GWA2_43_14]|uniref:Nudix hydrolase domain-containing protein n=1 Tax=Candidatus Gottesmanbacteria bacterium GW2011_GWA2_43_14 TaxID=1618443 RepID=A0A0G1DJH7_9BACT|nr:MAG: hypothetical protein UV73_C0005G0004 [Candidatus Gottesmanbacteria bacterium GW2011_GWA2_43_14]
MSKKEDQPKAGLSKSSFLKEVDAADKWEEIHRAVAVPEYRLETEGESPRVLLLVVRRKKKRGRWEFPGGAMEYESGTPITGETVVFRAGSEFYEETGVSTLFPNGEFDSNSVKVYPMTENPSLNQYFLKFRDSRKKRYIYSHPVLIKMGIKSLPQLNPEKYGKPEIDDYRFIDVTNLYGADYRKHIRKWYDALTNPNLPFQKDPVNDRILTLSETDEPNTEIHHFSETTVGVMNVYLNKILDFA